MIVKNLQTDCTHCGLPVPSGLLDPKREEQFCCHGCSAAWDLIQGSGLDTFYRMVDASGEQVTLQRREEQQFTEFDQAGFLEKFARHSSPDRMTITLAIDGLHCAACVWLLEKLPTIVPGTLEAKVNWSRATVTLRWDSEQVALSQIAQALHQLGYTPHPVRSSETATRRQNENRSQLMQIGVAAAAAGNNMLIAAALYFGMFTYMASGFETLFRVTSCIVGVASFLGPGRVFLRGAWNALKTRTPHMDLPIAAGLTAGTIAGLVNTVRGVGEIYFDSLSVLICLLLIGRWIQFRQQNRAADAVELLYRLTPQMARKWIDEQLVEVPVDELQVNDRIEVRPGDLIAVDGVVESGNSQVDESILTGEARPAKKTGGDDVLAGTKNLNSALTVRVLMTGRHTRINRIVELVEQATLDKPQIVQWANQIGGYFVVIVLALAALTFATWMTTDVGLAVDRAVALLIVACPCALAMATPLAISVALGRLARRKILVKAGDVLQSLSQPGVVWLDKTGTLTEGKMRVVQWHGNDDCLPMIAAAESQFNHPIAEAWLDFVAEPETEFGSKRRQAQVDSRANPLQPLAVNQLPGGISADFEGTSLLVGSRKTLESLSIDCQSWLEREQEILAQQSSPCWVVVNKQVVGLAALGDQVRPESRAIVDELRELGWTVGVLSGDHPEVVATIARSLGIENETLIKGGVTPEQKLAVVQESAKEFPTTVMVGDGVNDSAALAAATVGIAVHNGAEASLAAAPVYFGSPGLASIRDLLQASGSTTRTIRVNFAASLGYNLLGVGLAMAGLLNPLVAAILMPISSLTVISLSLNAARRRESA